MPYKSPEAQKEYYKRRYHRIKNDPIRYAARKEYVKKQRKLRPELEKNRQLKYSFGITLDEFNEMVSSQNNCCAICGSVFEKTPYVDHDHVRGRVRKLLCLQCNSGLGQFQDKIELLLKAVDYLKEFENGT